MELPVLENLKKYSHRLIIGKTVSPLFLGCFDPNLEERELICLLLFTCNHVVSVWRGNLLLWVLGMGYVILLCHSLSLPYTYFDICR